MSSALLNAKDNMLTADQAFAILADKLSSRFSTVRKAFLLNKGGGRGDGYIDRREFRDALERINIKMTGDEFRKLWKRFDSSGDGKISYTEFNNQIGPMVSPPSMGLKLNRPETPPMKEWMRKAVARAMKKKVTDIEQTFKDIDTDSSGRISHAEFIQALRKMGVRGVGDTESWQMMSKYRKPGNDSGEMIFDEFRDCMLDYLRVPSTGAGDLDEPASESLKSAIAAIEGAVGKRGDVLIAAFGKFDPEGRNEVDYGQFREALESVGVRLSKEQFSELCKKYDPLDDGGIYYREMTAELTGFDESKKEESTLGQIRNLKDFSLEPIINPITGHPYDHSELARRVAPRVGLTEVEVKFIYHLIGRRQTLKEAFIRFDLNRDGKLTPTELRRALEELDVDVSDELITNFFAKYDTNHDGTIDFDELHSRLGNFMIISDGNLSRLMLQRKAEAPSSAAAAASAAGTPSKGAGASASASSPAVGLEGTFKPATPRGLGGTDTETVATAALDLSPTAQKMRKVLGRQGMTAVLGDAKKIAAKRTDAGSPAAAVVPASQLRDTMAKHGVPLTAKEVRALSLKYHGDGPAASRAADGVVDVEAMLRDTFISNGPVSGAGAASPAGKSGRGVAASPRK